MTDGTTLGPLTGEQFDKLLKLIEDAAHAAVSRGIQRNFVLRDSAESGYRDAVLAARRSLVGGLDP